MSEEQDIAFNPLKKKGGRPKKKVVEEQEPQAPSSLKVYVVQNVLGVQAAFTNKEDLQVWAKVNGVTGFGTTVWEVEGAMSKRLGHISMFK